jgi:serine/threonine protein kinase
MYDIYLYLFIGILDLLKEKIGGGACGEVFKVESKLTQKQMAMKIIKLNERRNYEKIKAEFEVGVRLGSTCKFLVPLTELFSKDGFCCFVMEYCPGGDLEKMLKKNKCIPQRVFNYYKYHFFEGIAKNH